MKKINYIKLSLLLVTTLVLVSTSGAQSKITIKAVNGPSANPGKQRISIKIKGDANFPSNTGFANWNAHNRILLRMSVSLPDYWSDISEITNVVGNQLFNSFTQMGGVFTAAGDGYNYILFTCNSDQYGVGLAGGVETEILSFDLPDTWSCTNCVEIVTVNPPWATAGGYQTQTMFLNHGTGTDVIGTTTSGSLPVELTRFTAKLSDKKVITGWETASEQNSDYFIIEKSTDLENWIEVGIKDAANESNTTIKYSLIDEFPFDGISYYRLISLDNDGETETFDPVAITLNQRESSMVAYPNPSADGGVILDILNLYNQKSSLIVTSVDGKIVMDKEITPQFAADRFEIPTGTLADGIYEITLINKNIRLTEKLIVTK